MSRFARVALMFVGFVALVPVMAHAQASIAGVVRDASGGVLPGVTVTATSRDTNVARLVRITTSLPREQM